MPTTTDPLARVKEFFTKLSLAQRISLAVLGAAVLVAFGMLFTVDASGRYVALTPAGTPPEVASGVIESLKTRKVPYRFENGVVSVPPDRRDELFVQLYGEGVLPQGKNQFEWLWTQDVWTTTDARQRLQWTDTLRRRLEGAIGSMSAVEAAAVQISPGEDAATMVNARPAKASVHLKLRGGRSPADVNARAIAEMVAASVPNLEPEAVIITDTGMHSYEVPDPRMGHVQAGTALQLKQEHEAAASKKAREALAFLSKVSVQANVELDLDSVQKDTHKPLPAETAPRTIETSERSPEAVGGIPGVGSVLEPGGLAEPGAIGPAAPSITLTPETTSRREFENVFGSERTQTVSPPGRIRSMTLAVVVPYQEAALAVDGTRPASAEQTQENLANNLRDWTMLVARACNVELASIKMHPVVFAEPLPPAAAALPSFSVLEFFARHGERALLVLLGLAALWMIWRIVRSAAPRDIMDEIERVRREMAIPPEGPSLDPATAASDLRSARLQEKVTDLVRRSPSAGANLVRNWIVRGE